MLKATSIVGSIVALIALVIVLVKSLIAFVGFISIAVKIIIVLAFLLVFGAVGFMIFRGWQNSRKRDDIPF